ncbi:hypothetical protein ACF08N_26795 [Streptomyces sp. NPDC015127]|uniref:hypothetical protein n=1 Tax=Streptomyces sp. NPDC015127 TaxID=3364939 RepID=UPI0036FD8744
MRLRHALATAGLGTALILGVPIAPAQAAAAGHDAHVNLYVDGKTVASASFISLGDRFEVTKRSSYGGRSYLEYKYIRKDGTLQEGTHWGVSDIGYTMKFDHNFGEGRKVVFRLCVQNTYGWDDCTDDADGQWETGYA